MRNYTVILGTVLSFLFLISVEVSYATPVLQLDISNGTYDNTTETIMSTSEIFTLYALLNPKGGRKKRGRKKGKSEKALLDEIYYISLALTPKMAKRDMPASGLGSFKLNGATIDVDSSMEFGTPPVENSKNLPKHGIFKTYYTEVNFMFSELNEVARYNTENETGGFLSNTGSGAYYHSFELDISDLADGYGLHFDLYSLKGDQIGEILRRGKMRIGEKSPFSHDAQTGSRSTPVPEPATIIFLGIGISTLGLRKRGNT